MTAAVIDQATMVVINTIVADANVDPAPEGTILVNVPDGVVVNIGFTWSEVTGFVDPSATTQGG